MKDKISSLYRSHVFVIMNEWNWKGNIQSFIKRIISLCKKQKLSTREVLRLKKLLQKVKKNEEINFDEIVAYFPGKTVESLINASASLQKQ